MASTIDWGKTIWYATDNDGETGTTRTSSTIADGVVLLQNSTNLLDGSGLELTSGVSAGSGTLYLGENLDEVASIASGLASESSNVENAFAKVGYNVTSDRKLEFTSVELSAKPQVYNADSEAFIGTILGLNSNSITKVEGGNYVKGTSTPIDDGLYVGSFGSKGTINLNAGNDMLVFVEGMAEGKSIVVDGGVGNDVISTAGNKITYKMASYDATSHSVGERDVVIGWKENTGIIQLGDDQAFSNISLVNYGAKDEDIAATGNASNNGLVFYQGAKSDTVATANKVWSSFGITNADGEGYDTEANSGFVTYMSDGENIKKTLLFGGYTEVDGYSTSGNDINLYVGTVSLAGEGREVGNIINFSQTGKKRIYLGHSDGVSAEFEDTAQYVNVEGVVTSSLGGSWAFGDVEESVKGVSLIASGAGDSLAGLGSAEDTLTSTELADNGRVYFGVSNTSGADVVQDFKVGNGKKVENTDVALLIGGIDFENTKSDGTNLILSASKENSIEIQEAGNTENIDAETNGTFINYQVGIGNDFASLYTALMDISGSSTLKYSADADYFIGGLTATGETTLETGANKVALNFGDGNKSMHGVKNIDASSALEGSMVLGNSDLAQSITGSASGTSFICGGFGGAMGDLNADTLVGSGVDSVTTGYFVGKNLGKDVVNDVSSNDVINFLGTKSSDLTGITRTDGTWIAYFSGGNEITFNAKDSFTNVKDVTVAFEDKSLKWNGTAFVDA